MPIIQLAEQEIEIIQKRIKNLHLSVYPPKGQVKVSAPTHMNQDTIRAFLISKLPWIRKQQEKILAQERESHRDYINRESHFFRGERVLLNISKTSGAHSTELKHKTLEVAVRHPDDPESVKRAIEQFYRDHLNDEIQKIIAKYEPAMNVKVNEFGIKKMKTKWGTCNYQAKRIWVNLELAKKPPECLEYLVVHEMVHIIEPSHNARFKALMDKYYPSWRVVRDELNRLPVRQEGWEY
jgi:predicted metal-dependent hydrolase